jgi:hypothetical protein
VTRIVPTHCSTRPTTRALVDATSAVPGAFPPSATDTSTDQVNAAVTRSGSAIAPAATSTADPTVALGLNRMIRKAAS